MENLRRIGKEKDLEKSLNFVIRPILQSNIPLPSLLLSLWIRRLTCDSDCA